MRPPATPGDTEALVDALASTSRVLVAITARTLARLDVDVTLPQYRAMVVLATHGPLRSAAVARELGVAPSTATRLFHRLVARDLVRRTHRPDDRRSVYVGLTEYGRELVGEAMRARRGELARLVAAAAVPVDAPAAAFLTAFVHAAGDVAEPRWWQLWEQATQPFPDGRTRHGAG